MNRLTDEQVATLATAETWPSLNALAREVQHHRRIEAELRALHRTEAVGASLGYRYWCDCLGCGGVWPCPTIRILDGGEQCAPATSPATSTR